MTVQLNMWPENQICYDCANNLNISNDDTNTICKDNHVPQNSNCKFHIEMPEPPLENK